MKARPSKLPKYLKRLFWAILLVFVAMNFVAFMHAYKFTHFSTSSTEKTADPSKLSTIGKLKTLVLGVNNPRPQNALLPSQEYERVTILASPQTAAWYIPAAHSRGTVALFHGFSGEKSGMLDKSDSLLRLGYSTLLVDFMGSGESEGNQTTIGFQEAVQVKAAYDYLSARGERNISLFGTSMGAVAIMKAMQDYPLKPSSIILECPFGTMYETVCARFHKMGAPTFPMAGLLMFWGGIQNGFWAFGHNPANYASAIDCPTLLLYGEQDDKVSREEIDTIFAQLAGPKTLKTYPDAGHENYLLKYAGQWTSDVAEFLEARSVY